MVCECLSNITSNLKMAFSRGESEFIVYFFVNTELEFFLNIFFSILFFKCQPLVQTFCTINLTFLSVCKCKSDIKTMHISYNFLSRAEFKKSMLFVSLGSRVVNYNWRCVSV